MKRILLTGMSGTGKSAVVRELVARGYKAIDTDDGWCEPRPDGRQKWREDAIQALLDIEDAEVLFVAGGEENQARFHPQFDHIILLSAPVETLAERLATRSDHPYGSLIATRRVGHHASGFTDLAAFAETLAANWRGWPDERMWESIEHDLRIQAHHDGHVRLRVRLQDTDTWTWSTVNIVVEPGEQLTRVTQSLRHLASGGQESARLPA